MLVTITCGGDMLCYYRFALGASGQIGETLADALKAEARRRVEIDQFFGYITYTSLIARKHDRLHESHGM